MAEVALITAMRETGEYPLNNNTIKDGAIDRYIRKLGKQETFFYWNQREFAGNSQILLSLMVETDEALEATKLEEALETLQGRVQALRCRVSHLKDDLWLTESAQQRVRVQLMPRGDDWHAQYERILNDETLDLERGPMWRVLLLQDPSNTGENEATSPDRHRAIIYILISHVISDGMSNMFLAGQLLDILDHQLKDLPYINTTHIPLKEALDTSLQRQITGWSRRYFNFLLDSAVEIVGHYIYNWRRHSFSKLFVRPLEPATANHRSRAIHAVLSRQTTSCLLAASKQHGVTMGSVLTAATNLAAAHLTQEHRPGVQLSVRTPVIHIVSVNRYLPPASADYIRCEVAGVATYVPLLTDESDLWSVARDADVNLKKRLADQYPLSFLQLVNLFWRAAKQPLSIPGKWLMYTISTPIDTAFQINNFGRMDARMPKTSLIRLVQLHTTARQHPHMDLAMGIHLFGSVAGRLQYDLNYIEGPLERRYVARFSHLVVGILERIAERHSAVQQQSAVHP